MGEPGPQSKRKRSDSVDRRLQFAQWPRRYSNAFTVLTQAFYSCTHENTRKYSRCRNTSLSHFRKISRGRSMKIMKEREIASLCNLSNITKTDLNLREEKIDSLKRPIIETLQVCCQLGCQLRNNAFFERDAAKKIAPASQKPDNSDNRQLQTSAGTRRLDQSSLVWGATSTCVFC